MFKLFLKILKIAFLFFLLSSVLAVFYYKWMPVKITPLMVIRSVQHVVKGEAPEVHHQWVPLEEMSRYMPVAVMASEDQQFLHHHGFDFGAIQDAAVDRLKGEAPSHSKRPRTCSYGPLAHGCVRGSKPTSQCSSSCFGRRNALWKSISTA